MNNASGMGDNVPRGVTYGRKNAINDGYTYPGLERPRCRVRFE